MFPNLRAEAARANLTYTNLGKLLGVADKTIQNKMLGKSEFSLSEAQKLSKYFKCGIDYLFETEVQDSC